MARDGFKRAHSCDFRVPGIRSSLAVEFEPCTRKRGQKDFFLDAWNHAFVHLQKFKEGDMSEDHLGHLASNAAFIVWAVQNGVVLQDDFSAPKQAAGDLMLPEGRPLSPAR